MESGHQNGAQKLRQVLSGGGEIQSLQAIHHQHGHDGVGEHPAQIGNYSGGLPFFAENPLSCCCPQKGTEAPVELIQGGDKKIVVPPILPRLLLGHQGIGFVCQGKNQIWLLFSRALVPVNHREPVEQVPGIHRQGGQGGGEDVCSPGEHGHGHKLHGPRVDKCAHGQRPLSSGADTLKSGTNDLRKGTLDLKSGAQTLADGVSDLKDGADTLSDASDDVVDGISELKDGAEDLKDGMQEFYDEGISKIKDMADENLTVILDRLKALTSDEISYDTYSGRSDSMNGSVKFIIETDEIE